MSASAGSAGGEISQPELEAAGAALAQVGRDFYARGWALATGGNFSMRLGKEAMIITASGREKGSLGPADMVVLDLEAHPIPSLSAHGTRARPSAEALLHAKLYERLPDVGAVLHVHSPCATVLSRLEAAVGMLELTGYEMLKALSEVHTHEHKERVPIFANTQDMRALARSVDAWMDAFGGEGLHGYLVAGHGLYAWGRNIKEAHRHVEAFEFLFDCALRSYNVSPRSKSS